MDRSPALDELRDFLRDLRRPFGMRQLRRFLRGNWWILVLLLAAAGYGIQFSPYAPLLQFVTPKPVDEPYFEFVGNEGFDFETSPGTPFPAIDPDGDLIPVISGSAFPNRNYLTIWSLSHKKVVWRVLTDGIEIRYLRETPLPILYDVPKREFVVALNLGEVGPNERQDLETTLILIPRDSSLIRKKIHIPRLQRLCDISPSGNLLAGTRMHFIDKGSITDLVQPVIVNLVEGTARFEPIRAKNIFFEGEESAVVVRGDSIFRYDFHSQDCIRHSDYTCRTDTTPEDSPNQHSENTEYIYGSSEKLADGRCAGVWLRSNVNYPDPADGERFAYRHRDFLLRVPLDGFTRIVAQPLSARFYDSASIGKYQYYTYAPRFAVDPAAKRLVITRRDIKNRMEDFLLTELKSGLTYFIQRYPPSANLHGDGGLRARFLADDLIWIGCDGTGQFFHVGDIIARGEVR